MNPKLRFLVALLIPLFVVASACSDNDNKSPSSGVTPATVASTQAQIKGSVTIDFTGAPSQRPNTNAPFAVETGTKAIDAIKQAIGASNVGTKDFGGDLGLFITGFYGIEVQGNHFWEFSVNGKSSDVGVSSYVVQNGDVLSFKYASF